MSTATVSVIVSGVVAILAPAAAGVIQARIADRNHQYEREAAQAARRHEATQKAKERQAETYIDFISLMDRAVTSASPMAPGPGGASPSPLEYARALSRLRLFGSKTVYTAGNAWVYGFLEAQATDQESTPTGETVIDLMRAELDSPEH